MSRLGMIRVFLWMGLTTAVLASGCGKKTPPIPLDDDSPATAITLQTDTTRPRLDP